MIVIMTSIQLQMHHLHCIESSYKTLQQHPLQKEITTPQGMPTMHVDHSSTFCEKVRKHENMETSIHEKRKEDKHAIFPWEEKKEISIEICDLKRKLDNKLFCLSDTNW